MTEVARVKFSDPEFGESFYRSVRGDIEKANLLLKGFVQYLLIHAPLAREDTIHRMIGEVLMKYQTRLERKGVTLSKRWEKSLPETMVPEEPLRYIIDSIFQYGVSAVVPNGEMEVSTRSFMSQTGEEAGVREKDRCVELRVVFTGGRRLKGPLGESPVFDEAGAFDLLLQLAQATVRKYRGVLEYETDENGEKKVISVRVPSERRKRFLYRSLDQTVD